MGFRRGDRVVYVGFHPQIHNSDAIGAEGTVVQDQREDFGGHSVLVDWDDRLGKTPPGSVYVENVQYITEPDEECDELLDKARELREAAAELVKHAETLEEAARILKSEAISGRV
jgi:hypothetical protein